MTYTDRGTTLLFAGIASLAAVVLIILNIRMTGSALSDPIPTEPVSTTAELIPTEPVSTTAELIPTEPVSTTVTVFTNLEEILPTFQIPPKPVTSSVSADPKGISSFKIFILPQDTLESEVNKWFAVQRNIVVDQMSVGDYGGGSYLIVIGYHTGGAGKSSTRLELIDGENSEADAQAFLSSLDPSQTVRSVAAIAGSYSGSGSETTITIPIIFIIYE